MDPSSPPMTPAALSTTPPGATFFLTRAGIRTSPPTTVTEILTKVYTAGNEDAGAFAALIGGIVCAALILLFFTLAVLLWCMSRHKGSYVTNEMDDYNDEEDVDDDDDESVGSDRALQSREPLKVKEED